MGKTAADALKHSTLAVGLQGVHDAAARLREQAAESSKAAEAPENSDSKPIEDASVAKQDEEPAMDEEQREAYERWQAAANSKTAF